MAELSGPTIIPFKRPKIMGILNVTPDSFSDGGKYVALEAAVAQGMKMVEEGADILDIGGESTRPSHIPVSLEEEKARVLPVIEALRARVQIPLSIDTMKAKVAQAALDAGANIVNDVWGLQKDPAMAHVVAQKGATLILMHNQMEEDPNRDIVACVCEYLERSIKTAMNAGIHPSKLILDPGCGFGKTHIQSLKLVQALRQMTSRYAFPFLLGASRKRFIGEYSGQKIPAHRLAGSLATALFAARSGVHYLRVHDVAAHVEALYMWEALECERSEEKQTALF